MTEYHLCPACIDCPTCDGGQRRYPARWHLDPRALAKGELRPRCSECQGTGLVCTIPPHPILTREKGSRP